MAVADARSSEASLLEQRAHLTPDAFPEAGGLLSWPWLFALPLLAIVLAFLWASRGHLRETLTSNPSPRRARVFTLSLLIYVLGFQFLVSGNPIAKGNIYAPGAGIQASEGGRIECFDLSNPCSPVGPLYRIKVAPGQRFSVLTSVRNKGLLPVTLLGPKHHRPVDASTPGVDWFLAEIWSAPVDNEGVFPDESQLQPFRPVTIGPGGQAALVLVLEGGACADPNGVADRGTDLSYRITGVWSIVYELAFWRRESSVFPQFEISVPVDKSCMAEPGPSTSPSTSP